MMLTRNINLALEDARKLKLLRSQIKAGAEALKYGDFVEVEETELERNLAGLTTEAGNVR